MRERKSERERGREGERREENGRERKRKTEERHLQGKIV